MSSSDNKLSYLDTDLSALKAKNYSKICCSSSTLPFQGSCSFNFAKMNDSFVSLTRTILKFCMTDVGEVGFIIM